MKKAIIVVVVVVLLAGALGWFIFVREDSKKEPADSTSQTPPDDSAAAGQAVITYTDDGFSPSTLTVNAGTMVTVTNESGEDVKFSSDKHPVHTDDPELNQEALSPGDSQTFEVTQTGTFGYHNHLDPGQTGTIIVQ